MARGRLSTQRQIRLLEALQGRRLDEVYLLSPEFRKDLEREADRGERQFGRALLTREMLGHVEAAAVRGLEADQVSFTPGAPPSAAIPISPASARLVPDSQARDTVVIVPGNLGSNLVDIGLHPGLIWLNPRALAAGRIRDLKLAAYDGTELDDDPDVRITTTGAIPGLYDLLESDLRWSHFATRVFPYDWRKDVDHATVAVRLKDLLRDLGPTGRVHLVAHSLGAPVARRALQLLRDERGEAETRCHIGQLVLLGPANFGTFAAALGLAAALRELPLFKLFPPPGPRLQDTLKTFTALYQLLPWDENRLPSLNRHDVRSLDFWRGLIDRRRLLRFLPPRGTPWGATIDTGFFNDRTTVILGFHPACSTAGGVEFRGKQRLKIRHQDDVAGDGWVPHICSILDGTKAYLARGVDHIRLPMAPRVIRTIIEVLQGESAVGLPEYQPTELQVLEPRSS